MSLPKDIVKNILSDYIGYDQLLELIKYIPSLYMNPKRVITLKDFHPNGILKQKRSYIDKYSWIVQHYHEDGSPECETSFKDNNGKIIKTSVSYYYDTSGKLKSKTYEDNTVHYIENYKDGKIFSRILKDI